MTTLGVLQWSLRFLLLPQSLLLLVSAYDAQSRWGQATVLISDALFVYGGKVDQYNQFAYQSAPNVNDILYLPLSSRFSAASPPWELVSSSTNASASQGPALAWSTLSALNNSECLLFGGQTGADSASSSGGAGILDVFSRVQPQWTLNLTTSNEPSSRMRHSSVTTNTGLVFVFGGERTDGSNIGFSDHFYYSPNTQNFTFLPTDNGPPDLFGHASTILSDGRILVFGGYSPSQSTSLPFSTVWALDTTQSTFSWTVITTATTTLPSPRVAFAAVLIQNGKIIIHGGSDSAFQTNFNDGWILDTTQSPMTWTVVDGLSQLGARRDHFAVSSGSQVLFGFGYGNDGPAPASLQIFNPSSGNFVNMFTPAPVTSTPSQTLPPTTQTSQAGTQSSQPFSSTEGIHPTSTVDPGTGVVPPEDDHGAANSTTAIVVGTSFGVISLLVVGLGAAYYVRRRRREHAAERRFTALNGDDDDGDGSHSPHFGGAIPAATMHEEHRYSHPPRKLLSSLGIASALGVASRMRSVRGADNARRDMLADEDARSFGEWYDLRRRDGSSGSAWSLRSILGSRFRSRDGSTTSHGSGIPPLLREKSDPFSDGASLMRDEETGFVGAAVRPRARRDTSYASHTSSTSYRDPFVDPIHEEAKELFEPTDLYDEDADDDVGEIPSIRHVTPLAPLRTTLPPLSQQQGHLLSPLSEHTSQSTLPLQNFSSSGSSHAHSSDNIFSPNAGGSMSHATSLTSMNQVSTPEFPALATSIIGAKDLMVLSGNKPMRRSDSWWAKFSRTSLLDRRSSTDASRNTRYDIRDPTPAPRLGAIEEGSMRSPPSSSKHSPMSADAAKNPISSHPPVSAASTSAKVYEAGAGHGKSMSSLRTADSEAIERMAGMMDVTQREKSRDRWGSGSTSSGGGLSVDTDGSTSASASVSEMGDNARLKGKQADFEAQDLLVFTASPVEEPQTSRAFQAARLPSPLPTLQDKHTTKFAPLPALETNKRGKVSDRVQEFERRMSLGEPTSPPPTNTKRKEERTKKRVQVDYGLVPRASLFVANPDHKLSNTSDS